MGRKCENKEGDLNWEHMSPSLRALGYKKRSDFKEGDVMNV